MIVENNGDDEAADDGVVIIGGDLVSQVNNHEFWRTGKNEAPRQKSAQQKSADKRAQLHY